MSRVKAIVIRSPGANCDGEAVFALEKAGAEVALVHINRLSCREYKLADYQILLIPGGFTYGDDISGGKVLANELKLKLSDDMNRFVADGKLIMGICNGFQIMIKAGILPKLNEGELPKLTLTYNDSGKFECRWVHLSVNQQSPCIYTKGIERLYVPVAHGEGKLIGDPKAISTNNIVLYYTDEQGDRKASYPYNPNGSIKNIAGICDDTGRIFALMPHPERHVLGTQHPQWTRLGAKKYGEGFPIFQNAIKFAEGI